MKIILKLTYFLVLLLATSCSNNVETPLVSNALPPIFPDYIGVTIPAEIAPMNFDIAQGVDYQRVDVVIKGGKRGELHVNAKRVNFPIKQWRKLLQENLGDSLQITVSIKQGDDWKQYQPFSMYISPYAIDYGIVYRKIAPGYELYNKMGIYERNLSTFEEKALLENTLLPNMCVNCHSFNQTNPTNFSLHIRGEKGGTLMRHNQQEEILDTKTATTLSACVYPYWHPSGKYIAYSTNLTAQSFHAASNKRIEVFDSESDVLAYHPETHQLITSPLLQMKEAFETFPAFSPDGKTLYFCSSKSQNVPESFQAIKYSLCSIPFSEEEGSFGTRIDTLISVENTDKSIAFPRPSYDGKYLMYTQSDYGTFPIWHKEADLWLMNLADGTTRPIIEVNSNDTESFHNWSSNSHWFLFSSRRDDGLYTRIYLASIDDEGRISKPFLLPQKHPWEYYDELLYSYNVPDFINQPINLHPQKLEREVMSGKRTNVTIR